MQRIEPLSQEGNDQLAATYERITATRGYVSAILMSLSHAPAGLDAFARFAEYVRHGTELPGRVRELSVLAIAVGNQYAWSHHHPPAIRAGVTQQELDLLGAIVYGFGASVGFGLVLVLFAALRARLVAADVPLAFRGAPIALVTAGLMALAFMGFAGLGRG